MYKVDKGVTMPEGTDRRNRYPFKSMKIGDSFFVPDKDTKGKLRPDHTIREASQGYRLRHNKEARFSVRKVEGGHRCWRTK